MLLQRVKNISPPTCALFLEMIKRDTYLLIRGDKITKYKEVSTPRFFNSLKTNILLLNKDFYLLKSHKTV
jgi:hypothetical protein